MRPRALLLCLAAAAFAACGKDSTGPSTPAGKSPSPPTAGAPAEADDHGPRHGGSVLELGEHEGHLEILHDAATGTLTAYVYDADMKPVATEEPPVINLTKGGTQVTMTPLSGAGPKSDAWKAVNPALKVDPLDGRIRLKIGDRTYQPALEHEHK